MGLLFGITVLCTPQAFSASPQTKQRPGYEPERPNALNEIHTRLSNLHHEVHNHETEIRMIEEKLTNQEDTLETLRQKLFDNSQAHKDLLKGSNNSLEAKIDALDAKTKGLIADLGILKNHANETSGLLSQYKQKIGELENIIEVQKQQMNHFEAAIRSLVDLIQARDAIPEGSSHSLPESPKTYRVQPGDTLEKIAKSQKTTIQALKEKNKLSQDKIIVGQKLAIP